MRRAIRVLGIVLVIIAALLLSGYAMIHLGSQRLLARTYNAPLVAFGAPASDDQAVIAEGERLARIRGCNGCHGSNLEGRVFVDEPFMARIVAPDLTRIAREYSDAELERAIRRGVTRSGRSVWIMPSPMFYHLSDEDLGTILAYVRSVPPGEGLRGEVSPRILGRVGVATGQFTPLAQAIDSGPRMIVDRADPRSVGRYLALTSCSECHGADLRGLRDGGPNLALVAGVSFDEFSRILRTGQGLGGRELDLMQRVAVNRFVHFTDDEVSALYEYLCTLDAPVPDTPPSVAERN